jgi:hypothetical protein
MCPEYDAVSRCHYEKSEEFVNPINSPVRPNVKTDRQTDHAQTVIFVVTVRWLGHVL